MAQSHHLSAGQGFAPLAPAQFGAAFAGNAGNAVFVQLIAIGGMRVGTAMGTGTRYRQAHQHGPHGLGRAVRGIAAAITGMATGARQPVEQRSQAGEVFILGRCRQPGTVEYGAAPGELLAQAFGQGRRDGGERGAALLEHGESATRQGFVGQSGAGQGRGEGKHGKETIHGRILTSSARRKPVRWRRSPCGSSHPLWPWRRRTRRFPRWR